MKEPCPKCRETGGDTSGDNLARYPDGGAFCFVCKYREPAGNSEAKPRMSKLTLDQVKTYPVGANPSRCIPREVAEAYDVRVSYDESTGEAVTLYYPYYQGGKMASCKTRRVDSKDFFWVGTPSTLFGKQACVGSSILIITEGEEDALAVKTVLTDKAYGVAQTHDVVSLPNGASLDKIVRSEVEFFEKYKRVYICFDNDEPGKKASIEVADWLSTITSTYLVQLPTELGKDASDYLVSDHGKELRQSFAKAKLYEPEGVVNGVDISLSSLLSPLEEGYPLPFKGMQDKLHGIRKAEIITLCAGCVDRDTEYLTPEGWKPIGDYESGLVGQYNNGELEFVEPSFYHVYQADTLTRFRTKYGVDQVLSDNHNVVYWNRGYDNPQKILFKDLKVRHENSATGFPGRFKTTFNFSGKGLDITESELRLQVAVIADGRIVKEGADNYTQMRFKKKRKFDRLINLCIDGGLKFKIIHSGPHYEVIVWPKWTDKVFDSKYYQCSQGQLMVILDEMRYWDGSLNGCFTSTKQESVDFIQFAYSATGVRAAIYVDKREYKYNEGYCGLVSPAANATVGITNRHSKVEMEEYKTKDGKMYCFTVPSGMLVLRRSGNVFITGNSGIGKSTLAREIAKSLIEQGCSVANVALEDQMNVAAQALIALDMNIPLNKFRFAPPPEEDVKPHYDKMIANGRTYFYKHFGGLNSENMMNRLYYYARSKACDFIILDHLSMVISASGGTNERKDIDTLMTNLAKMVVETGVGLIQIVHLKRTQGDKSFAKGGEVELTDLRGSAALEQLSWAVVGLERDQQGDDSDFTRVRILKNRTFGFTGLCDTLKFDTSTGRLKNVVLDPAGE